MFYLIVPEVDLSHDPPEIVDPVRVVERHAPAVLLRRKTPQEQDSCTLRRERLERMFLNGHDRSDKVAGPPPGIFRWRSGAWCGAFANNDEILRYAQNDRKVAQNDRKYAQNDRKVAQNDNCHPEER